jgi:hypothetical protein
MLNRWSVNLLLKSVISVMAAAIVLMLASGAWTLSRDMGSQAASRP